MDKYLTETIFWKKRAKKYNKLQWAKREKYIKAFIKMCETKKEDKVLDLGTGTGTIAFAISPLVKKVIGVDYSDDMLQKAKKHNNRKNIQFVNADIRNMPFPANSFDKVTARMVFHHLLGGTNRAISEIKRILKPGGLFCLSEGVPPDRCVADFYKEVFRLKEKRIIFFPQDLKKIFITGGFQDIKMKQFIMKHCSIRNWLENSLVLTLSVKEKIYQMHLNLHTKGKKAYNMEIAKDDCYDDCYIDMKFIIISGRK